MNVLDKRESDMLTRDNTFEHNSTKNYPVNPISVEY